MSNRGAYVSFCIKKNIRNRPSNTKCGNFLKIALTINKTNMNQKEAENIVDSLTGIGFQDKDGFKSLEDAKFSYFSKYSDSQLDEIYEVDVCTREVINKIRKIRQASWEWV